MRKDHDPPQDPLKVLHFLLHDLCVDWGFCNRLTAEELLPPGAVLSATDFACGVVRAEGMNPDYDTDWVQNIERRFVERFGTSAVRNPA